MMFNTKQTLIYHNADKRKTLSFDNINMWIKG